MGYYNSQIYRVYDPIRREIIKTRDAKFDEMTMVHSLNSNSDDEEVIVNKESEYDIKERIYLSWDGSPESYGDATKGTEKEKWAHAMKEEYESLDKNGTWELVTRPEGKNVISGKWTYRIKTDSNGNPVRFKARYVARGFTQIKGVDYDEVFAPTARSTSFRIVLCLAVKRSMECKQYDVETAYLNGLIKEDIYIEQPEGFVKGDKVCKLKKAIYGLKQAGREWNTMITKFFKERNFRASESDACLFFKRCEGRLIIILLYVDDLIVAADSGKDISDTVADLKERFKIKELGDLSFYLGVKLERDKNSLKLSQEAYRLKVLEKFKSYRHGRGLAPISKILDYTKEADNSKKDFPFQQILGSMMYLSTSTRPDITFAISFLSRHMKNPCENDEKMISGILTYLERTGNLELGYKKMVGVEDELALDEMDVSIYCDSDWAGDKEDCASTSGYLCFVNGNLISWRSKKQDRAAQSSTEAEYIALYHGVQEAIWVKQLLEELDFKIKGGSVKVYQDNKGAIHLANNAGYSARTKHMALKYHFSRQAVSRGDIKIEYVKTDNMLADGLTKAIGGQNLEKLLAGINLKKAAS